MVKRIQKNPKVQQATSASTVPKNMQKKRSSGLVPQRVPTVMKMQHRQHVDKKDRRPKEDTTKSSKKVKVWQHASLA